LATGGGGGGRSPKWSKGGPKVADWRRAPSGCVTPLTLFLSFSHRQLQSTNIIRNSLLLHCYCVYTIVKLDNSWRKHKRNHEREGVCIPDTESLLIYINFKFNFLTQYH
jgi:hypothetical protein